MATMQSTVRRIETDELLEKSDHPPKDGWQPAGAPLTDDRPFGIPPAPPSSETDHDFLPPDLKVVLPLEPVSRETTDDLPGVGEWVVYHMREGDSRARRTYFPALVMAHEETPGTLKLWLVIDDGDSWMQDRVPARTAPEPGWVRQAPRRDPLVAELTAKLGEFIDTMSIMQEHIEALEAEVSSLKKKPAKKAK